MARPTPELVARVMASIHTSSDADYFFDKLSSPDWIVPLREAGMFREPPAPIRDGDLVQLPSWSASRYLVRMAPLAPEEVSETIRAIPPTDNGRVQFDLVEAVIAMPDAFAVQLADEATKWVQSPLLLGLPSKVGELISRLARAGATSVALKLLGELIRLDPPESEDEAVGFRWGIRSRLREWDYGHLLKTSLPDVVAADASGTVKLLVETMMRVLSFERGPDYFSWSWRSAIEDHEQNNDREQLDALVTATRDAAEFSVRADATALAPTVELLNSTGTSIGDRIGIHLVRLFASAGSKELLSALVDPARIGKIDTHHEYWLLLKDRFASLSDADRVQVLDLIKHGPTYDDDVSSEDQKRYRENWILRYAAALAGQLTPAEEEMLGAETPNSDPAWHPEFLHYMSVGFTGPTSPLSADELAGRSVDEILDYLGTWEPGQVWNGPTPEGLARALAGAVDAAPDKFAADAPRFADLDPTYARGLLQGFRTAAEASRRISWEPVLGLARLVVDKPRVIKRSSEGRHEDADPDWGWARNEVAHLIASGCKSGDSEMPIEYRDAVWEILAVLAEDPEPDPEYEARYGGTNMDPMTLSLNTVRGQAFGALMDYMLWVRRDQERREDHDAEAAGFDAMPELRDMLDRHLDPGVDPSAAIRSVYGRMVPWLTLVDEPWVREQLPRIFPEDDRYADLRDGAWDTYIVYCRVYDTSFAILEQEYSKAIDRIGTRSEEATRHNDPDHHLGEHLVIQYWRGQLDLAESGLIRRFFERADDNSRAAALNLVGRSLEEAHGKTKPDPPEDLLGRLQALWEWRIGAIRTQGDAADSLRELRQIGWWYGSGVFDPEWGLTQLIAATRLAGSPEGEHLALKQMVKDVERVPLLTMQALDQMLRRDSERWLALGYKADVRVVLQAAIDRGNEEARQVAVGIVHELGAQGFREYRDLLPV